MGTTLEKICMLLIISIGKTELGTYSNCSEIETYYECHANQPKKDTVYLVYRENRAGNIFKLQ